MMDTTTYFEKLAVLMREREVPQERVDTLVSELTAYAAETGDGPVEEFGPVAELAEQLSERERAGLDPGFPEPEDGAETWVWTADAFKEQRLLDRFGSQGWEVDKLDRLGRFVCRRDLEHPMRWEYLRATVGHLKRPSLTEQLGPEGWEQCGVWGPFTYFKRPGAVLAGPAARIGEPPAPPRKRVYIGKWLYAWIAVWVAVLVALLWRGVPGLDLSDGGTLAGVCVGLLVGGALAWSVWRAGRRQGELSSRK